MTAPEAREILSIADLPDLARVEEVASFFRSTVPIVRTWIKKGKFPNSYKQGRGYIIPKQDVISLMETMYGKR